jgi:hypothetical protein
MLTYVMKDLKKRFWFLFILRGERGLDLGENQQPW